MSDSTSSNLAKKKRCIIHEEARKMAYRVVTKVREEKKNGHLFGSLDKPFERAAHYTGLSIGTLRKIYTDGQAGILKVNLSGVKKIFNLDDFDRHTVHQSIEDYIMSGSKLGQLARSFQEKYDFPWGKLTFIKMANEMGYAKKRRMNTVTELPVFASERKEYLKKIQVYRQNNRKIVYIDETWFDHIPFKKYWRIEAEDAVITDVNAKDRLILIHAASGDGFLDEVKWLFEVGVKHGDLQVQMSKENFELWVTNLLIPNLPPNSVVVMDSACYHNEIAVDLGLSTTQEMLTTVKTDLKDTPNLDKNELPDLVKDNASQIFKPKYKIDAIIESHGHDVLRIPTFMNPQFNPMLLTWEKISTIVNKEIMEVRNKDIDINTKIVRGIVEKAVANMTLEDWHDFDAKVKDMENVYWERDLKMEEFIEKTKEEIKEKPPTIISSSSSESESDSE